MKPTKVSSAVEESTMRLKAARDKKRYDDAKRVMDSARPVQPAGQKSFDDEVRALHVLREPPERVEDVRQRCAIEVEMARTRMGKRVVDAQLNTKKALREEIRNAEEEMEKRVLEARLRAKKALREEIRNTEEEMERRVAEARLHMKKALREEIRNAKEEMKKSVLAAKESVVAAKNKVRRALVTRNGRYEVGEEIGRG